MPELHGRNQSVGVGDLKLHVTNMCKKIMNKEQGTVNFEWTNLKIHYSILLAPCSLLNKSAQV